MLYVSTNAIPSHDVERSTTKIRYPSQTVLDENNRKIPKEGKDKIVEAVRKEFQLELGIADCTGGFDGNRQTAFELARQRLSLEKLQSYAEQFQGMYSLTRGLVVAFSTGAFYYAGWVLSTLHCRLLPAVAATLALLSLLTLAHLAIAIKQELAIVIKKEEDRKRKSHLERYFGYAWLVTSFMAGWNAGFVYKVNARQCEFLAFAAGIGIVLSILCYVQYRSFTTDFARTVWLNFATFVLRDQENRNTQITQIFE